MYGDGVIIKKNRFHIEAGTEWVTISVLNSMIRNLSQKINKKSCYLSIALLPLKSLPALRVNTADSHLTNENHSDCHFPHKNSLSPPLDAL